jgi:hypothetical protein
MAIASSSVVSLAFILSAAASAQSVFNGAPPPFGYRDGTAVPVDFQEVTVSYSFDIAKRQAIAQAKVRFVAGQAGFPMLDLVSDPTALELDGEAVAPADFQLVADPQQATRLRVLRRRVDAGSEHELEIRYPVPSDLITFGSGSVRVGFFMNDLADGGREFFEQYGPASFEFDQVKYHFDVEVTGTSKAHRIFTNGTQLPTGANKWTVDFPDYFTTSSIYFHLFEEGRFQHQTYTFDGAARDFSVTVYAESASSVGSGVTSSRRVLAELEQTYGPFAHDHVVAYITPSGGGMEHCGATMTSLSALGHELTHSWFARGVMPANGNAGWIDEAIASWRDNGYPRASGAPNRSPVNLGAFSAYRRDTTRDAYTLGAKLISEFDFMFAAQGGMRSVLRGFFDARKRTAVTVEDFKSHLEESTGQDLTPIFRRYVFGRNAIEGQGGGIPVQHPRPYTKEELKLFR